MTSTDGPRFQLHTYFRSSCSGRLRIALHYKGLPFEQVPVHLLKGEQSSAEHVALNPSSSVPVLSRLDEDTSFPIGQSVAALEYLEEAFPDHPRLLPADPLARAKVRTLVNIVACDVQPVTNSHILAAVEKMGQERAVWARKYTERGLGAFEAVAKKTAGKFCVGDEMSLADVFLVPAMWGAQRYGTNLNDYPTIKNIFESLSSEDAVVKAHWKNQPDTPEDLRN